MSNRAERRRAERDKRKGEAVYQVKAKDFEYIAEEAIRRVTLEVLPKCLFASLEVLHTKFGFGKERLRRFAEGVFDVYDGVDREYVTLEDIAKAIDEATGISIKRAGENGFTVDTDKSRAKLNGGERNEICEEADRDRSISV